MNKTRVSDSEDTGARDIAKAEIQHADINARALTAMKNRVREFYTAVEYAVFDSESSAPSWAATWFNYLLTGDDPGVEKAKETRPGGDGIVVVPDGVGDAEIADTILTDGV